jgi:CheY-like chemotaxis protein
MFARLKKSGKYQYLQIEIIEGLSKIIRNLGYDCLTAKSGKKAIKIIRQESPELYYYCEHIVFYI